MDQIVEKIQQLMVYECVRWLPDGNFDLPISFCLTVKIVGISAYNSGVNFMGFPI